MGIYYSGGMIVGCNAAKVEDVVCFEGDGEQDLYGTSVDDCFDEFYEWYEHHDMETMSSNYDAGTDNQIVGYKVKDIEPLSPEFDTWLANVQEKARLFKELTGCDAQLIGTQNIW